eukprot:15137620-Alexandrium_andersonii.AAC.1
MLPLPLLALVLASAWQRLLVLGRWRCKHRLFSGWPSPDKFAYKRTAPTREALATEAAVGGDEAARQLQDTADLLRRMAAAYLATAVDEDERAALVRDIEAAVIFTE